MSALVFLSIRIRKRNVFLFLSSIIVAFMLVLSLVINSNINKQKLTSFDDRAAYLNDFGYNVFNSNELVSDILIPDSNGELFYKHNKLQLCCGFDLEPYKTKSVKRYSYSIGHRIVSIYLDDGYVIGGDVFDNIEFKYISLCEGSVIDNGDYKS